MELHCTQKKAGLFLVEALEISGSILIALNSVFRPTWSYNFMCINCKEKIINKMHYSQFKHRAQSPTEKNDAKYRHLANTIKLSATLYNIIVLIQYTEHQH